ncbi:MAG: hypothetical protein WC456_01435 [Patescibacteria group bacterium]
MDKPFLIFTDALMRQHSVAKQSAFFREVIDQRYGTIFMPEELDGSDSFVDTLIVQLSCPVFINTQSVLAKGKISLSLLEQEVQHRRIQIKKAIVIGGNEAEFVSFEAEGFSFIIVGQDPPAGESVNHYVKDLSDVLPKVAELLKYGVEEIKEPA